MLSVLLSVLRTAFSRAIATSVGHRWDHACLCNLAVSTVTVLATVVVVMVVVASMMVVVGVGVASDVGGAGGRGVLLEAV